MTDGGRFSDLAGQAAVRQAVEAAPRVERVLTAALIMGGALVLATSPLARRVVWQVGRRAVVVGLPWLLRRHVKQAWRAAGEPAPLPADATAPRTP